ncbi:MAG: hypothetical protein ABEJ62_01320, partial [Candidatus Nanohaloarchaea archaeon]
MEIDTVDFSILKVIADAERPIWKKEAHRRINQDPKALEESKGVSVQTIGRRINELKEKGLLKQVMMRPESINREWIIGFRTTEKGGSVMGEKREGIIRDFLSKSCIMSDGEIKRDPETIRHLVAEELSGEPSDEILSEFGKTELLTLLSFHYLKERANEVMEP